jgi:hypothetical protein
VSPVSYGFLCISIHSVSSVWVCGGWPEDPVSPVSYRFPMYFYTFCLSSVGLRWVAGRSGVALFLWISYVFLYILPLQCGSAVGGRRIRCRPFPIDFLCISIHSASPVWVCGGWPEDPVSPVSYGFLMYFHTFYLSSVGLWWVAGRSGVARFLWITYVFLHILPLQCGSAVGGRKIRCRQFPLDFLCISLHSASPVWVCGGWPEDPVSPVSHGFPMYFYTFCLSSVGLRWVAGRSGVAHFIWICYVCLYMLPLQCGSAVGGRKIRCRPFLMDFLSISIHSASPVWVCGGWPEDPVSPISCGFPMHLHTFCLSSVGLL